MCAEVDSCFFRVFVSLPRAHAFVCSEQVNESGVRGLVPGTDYYSLPTSVSFQSFQLSTTLPSK